MLIITSILLLVMVLSSSGLRNVRGRSITIIVASAAVISLLFLPLMVSTNHNALLQSQSVFGQPSPPPPESTTSSFFAKASTGFTGAESFYAFHIKLNRPGVIALVDTVRIQFPSSFDISNARIVQAFGNPTLSKELPSDIQFPTLIFKYNPATAIDTTILVDGIINPPSAGSADIVLTAEIGGGVVFGPLTSTISLVPFGNFISNNTITSGQIVEDAIAGRELAGVSKILFFDCDFNVVSNARPSFGVNTENRGWVTSFGLGAAQCDAPGVEEGDIAFIGPLYEGASNIVYQLVSTKKDMIQITYKNLESVANTGDGFHAGVIVLKK